MMQFNSAIFQLEDCRISINKEEEIKRLTMDENLNEVQRSYLILTKGQSRQKQAIYNNLHKILLEPNGINTLLPIIKIELLNQTEQIQVLAAESLLKFEDLNNLDIMKLTLDLLQTYSQPVVQEWIKIFSILYEKQQINVERTIIQLTEFGQPEVGRWVGSKMIGIVTQCIRDNIKGKILDRLRLLCQDSDVEIRQLIAEEVLQTVVLNISENLIEMYLFDKLLELMYDSNLQVKCSAITTFFKVQINFPIEQRNPRVFKLAIEFMQSSNSEIQYTMAKISGQLIYDVYDIISQEFTTAFLQQYEKYSQTHPYWYLYNLPGMLNLFEEKNLIEQYCYLVQQKIELSQCLTIFTQVIRHMDFLSIQKDICPLLEQIFESSEVKLLIPQLNTLIQSLIPKNNIDIEIQQATNEHIQDILKLISKYFQNINYRDLLIFLDNLQSFQHNFNILEFQNLMLPTLWKQAKEGSFEIRKKCIQVIAKYFYDCRSNYKLKDEIINKIEQFYNSNNFKKRINYVWWTSEMTKYMSRKKFKSLQYFKVLDLSQDRVTSVQLQLLNELPNLRKIIDENELIVKFKLVLRHFKKNGSKTIVDTLKWTKQQLKIFVLQDDRNNGLELEEFEEQLAREKDKEQEEEKKESEINFTNDKYVMNFINKYRRRHTVIGSKMNTKNKYLLHRSSILDESTSKKVQEIRSQVEKSRQYTELIRNDKIQKNSDISPIKLVKRQYSLKRGSKK